MGAIKAPTATNYKNFSLSAKWRLGGLITHETYVRTTPVLSPWVKYVRGAHLDVFYRDLMHVVLLGFARDLISSLLVEEILPLRAADRPAHLKRYGRLSRVWRRRHYLGDASLPTTFAPLGASTHKQRNARPPIYLHSFFAGGARNPEAAGTSTPSGDTPRVRTRPPPPGGRFPWLLGMRCVWKGNGVFGRGTAI